MTDVDRCIVGLLCVYVSCLRSSMLHLCLRAHSSSGDTFLSDDMSLACVRAYERVRVRHRQSECSASYRDASPPAILLRLNRCYYMFLLSRSDGAKHKKPSSQPLFVCTKMPPTSGRRPGGGQLTTFPIDPRCASLRVKPALLSRAQRSNNALFPMIMHFRWSLRARIFDSATAY